MPYQQNNQMLQDIIFPFFQKHVNARFPVSSPNLLSTVVKNKGPPSPTSLPGPLRVPAPLGSTILLPESTSQPGHTVHPKVPNSRPPLGPLSPLAWTTPSPPTGVPVKPWSPANPSIKTPLHGHIQSNHNHRMYPLR